MLLQAWKRYRTGGQQLAIYDHVRVDEGGQAIVGVVTARGWGERMSDNPIHPAQRLQAALRCAATAKSTRTKRQVPGGERLAFMPHAWGARRCADRTEKRWMERGVTAREKQRQLDD
jgi:hypothetical protein